MYIVHVQLEIALLLTVLTFYLDSINEKKMEIIIMINDQS